jgi:hypothetical protein
MDEDLIEVSEKNPERVIMRVQRTANRLYKIELKLVHPVCMLANVWDVSWLWHGRLGHVNFQSLKMLVEKEMAGGIAMIEHPDQVCQSYLVEKQTRCFFHGFPSGEQMNHLNCYTLICVGLLHQRLQEAVSTLCS